MARAFIGIGSNINPRENVPNAIDALARSVEIRGISAVYRSAAVGRPEQPDFHNCVVEIQTSLKPADLKQNVLLTIESKLGRQRTEDKFAPRRIDLDIIYYEDGAVMYDPEILSRAFLAVPLAELDPGLVLPGTGGAISEIAKAIPGELHKL